LKNVLKWKAGDELMVEHLEYEGRRSTHLQGIIFPKLNREKIMTRKILWGN